MLRKLKLYKNSLIIIFYKDKDFPIGTELDEECFEEELRSIRPFTLIDEQHVI